MLRYLRGVPGDLKHAFVYCLMIDMQVIWFCFGLWYDFSSLTISLKNLPWMFMMRWTEEKRMQVHLKRKLTWRLRYYKYVPLLTIRVWWRHHHYAYKIALDVVSKNKNTKNVCFYTPENPWYPAIWPCLPHSLCCDSVVGNSEPQHSGDRHHCGAFSPRQPWVFIYQEPGKSCARGCSLFKKKKEKKKSLG